MMKTRGHELEGEWRGVYERACREEGKERNAVIKIQSQNKTITYLVCNESQVS